MSLPLFVQPLRFGLVLAPVLASSVFAQEFAPVVVTATRTETPLARSLADVTVIDSETIREAGDTTLPELLRRAGGVEISETGGAGSVSSIFLRGTRTSQTLFLVDGIRLESATSGTALPEFLPLSAIERIEIVRGPVSALYGSGAIGGVVQIFTRQPTGDGIRPFASAGLGSRSTRHLRAGFSGRAGATGVSLVVAQERTDGFDATLPGSPDRQVDDDGNRVDSLTAALTHRFGDEWKVGANLLVSDGRNEFDDAFSMPETAKRDFRTTAVSAYASGRPAPERAPGWGSTLRVGNTSIDYRYYSFDFAPKTDSRTISWDNTIDAGETRWQFGVETLEQRIDGEGLTRGAVIYAQDVRDTDSAFAGWERSFGDHQLRVVVRHDRIEAVGSENTGSIGWGWQATPDWLLRAGWGSAFRAPTFDDLYNPFSPNPTLRPERAQGVELAAEWRRGTQTFKATAFASRIRDAIELDAFFAAQNLETARVKGITFEADRRLGDFRFYGSVTFQDTEGERTDPATGVTTRRELARRARRHANLGANWQSGAWRVGADTVAQSARVDTNGLPMAGYAFVDLWSDYRIDRRWRVFGRIGNVGDRNYETAAGFRSAPRSVFVGLSFDGV